MWLVYNDSLRKNEMKYTLKLLDSLPLDWTCVPHVITPPL
jgi:hypothetical protein